MAYTTINKSTDYFNTKLYTGTGSSLALTGVGFQPDLVWGKKRSESGWHHLFDAVRGTTKVVYSNETTAEETNAQTLTAFGSDGFTLGTAGGLNTNNATGVAWNWKANGAGSANSDGSQSSTVSVNTTAGFSIVKFVNNQSYTANTFGHGLGVVPKMIIMKSLDDAYNWDVYHEKVGATKRLILNGTNAESNTTGFNSTAPTNQVFTLKSDHYGSGSNGIAYCFAEKTGYSKFGSYVGNGASDGTFVYTGFKPKLIIVKRTDTTGNWVIEDNKRIGYNEKNYHLYPNLSNVEGTNYFIDQLSNGFKIRGSAGDTNASGGSYIYMAFGQSLVGSNGVTAKAR